MARLTCACMIHIKLWLALIARVFLWERESNDLEDAKTTQPLVDTVEEQAGSAWRAAEGCR